MSRRDFVKKAIATSAAVGIAGASNWNCAPKQPKSIAVQLYTLRDLMKDDFEGIIEKVVEIGYDGVEFAGYYGRSAVAVKKLIDDLGLQCAGTHDGFNSLESNLDKVIEFNLELGAKYMTCPSFPGDMRQEGAKSFKEFGEKLATIGEKCKQAGIQLCYHNHSFEFEQLDGKYGFDILFEAANPELVQAEMDVYWVKHGGANPAELIRRYPNRCPLLHMKDMADDEEKSFAEVGEGILDFEAIIEASNVGGTQWYIVEQDRCKNPPLESIATSLKNLRGMLAA